MKKKIFSFILLLCLIIPCGFIFSGCQVVKDLLNKSGSGLGGGKYTVTFETNGGTYVKPAKYNEGDEIKYPEKTTREGYTFFYWCDENEEQFNFNNPMPAKNITLYAKWQPITYKVNLVSEIGKVDSHFFPFNSYVYGRETELPTKSYFDTPSIFGWDFKGWYTNPNFRGEKVEKIKETDIGDLTFYAKWEEILYTATYYDENGEEIQFRYENSHFKPGQELELPSYSKVGYKFLGWLDLETNEIVTKIDSNCREDRKFQAQIALKEFHITYVITKYTANFSEELVPIKEPGAWNNIYVDTKVYHYGDALLDAKYVIDSFPDPDEPFLGWHEIEDYPCERPYCMDYDTEEVTLYSIFSRPVTKA